MEQIDWLQPHQRLPPLLPQTPLHRKPAAMPTPSPLLTIMRLILFLGCLCSMLRGARRGTPRRPASTFP